MNQMTDLMGVMGKRARAAARVLATAGSHTKRDAILWSAEEIGNNRDAILRANETDLETARKRDLSSAMIDRLALDDDRLEGITASLGTVGELPDPVGEVLDEWNRPSGLRIKKVSMPLGVIGIIYESRPNVTVDAGSLCLKSGNASILRGGTDSTHSSRALNDCMVKGLEKVGLPRHSIQLVPTGNREFVGEMLRATGLIDVIVPRGGKGLVARVQSEARVPVFAHLEGICHVYVDVDADAGKARRVVLNAKTRRTGICGAAECLLIDRPVWQTLGKVLVEDLLKAGVEVRADEYLSTIPGTIRARDEDYGMEFLDMKMAVRVVDGVEGAIDHIGKYGSGHTDAIITESDLASSLFFNQLDSAILMKNASTQFADGGEFGMGAEIGIATGRIHARGPVGARQLTSFRYLVEGDGTIRAV